MALSSSLTELLVRLAGNYPSREDIQHLSGDVVREWARIRGLNHTGMLKTVRSRLEKSFYTTMQDDALESSPKRQRLVRHSEGGNLRASPQEGGSQSQVSLPSSSNDVESDSEDSSDREMDQQAVLKQILERLDRIESTNSASSEKLSDSESDWWVSKVCDFTVGPYAKSQSAATYAIEPLLATIRVALNEHLKAHIPAKALGKIISPAFKKLLEWSICTIGCWEFSDLKPFEAVLQSQAAEAAEKWAMDIFEADERIEPKKGLGSIILGERFGELAGKVAKKCELKLKGAKDRFAKNSKNSSQRKKAYSSNEKKGGENQRKKE